MRRRRTPEIPLHSLTEPMGELLSGILLFSYEAVWSRKPEASGEGLSRAYQDPSGPDS